jgi:two-component system response regulator MprA
MIDLMPRPESAPILVVDDDPKIVALVRAYLERERFRVVTAGDGRAALRAIEEYAPRLVVLDLMLPEVDGLAVIRRTRAMGDVPILVLSARGTTGDRIQGLSEGADDYLPKPFSLDELLARLRALLRRSSASETGEQLRVADLVLDPQRRTAERGRRPLELTKTEFDLLELLMFNAGIVLTRDQIYERIWGFDFETSSKSLDVYISYLRRKTEAADGARLIHTVRGVGYVARESSPGR